MNEERNKHTGYKLASVLRMSHLSNCNEGNPFHRVSCLFQLHGLVPISGWPWQQMSTKVPGWVVGISWERGQTSWVLTDTGLQGKQRPLGGPCYIAVAEILFPDKCHLFLHTFFCFNSRSEDITDQGEQGLTDTNFFPLCALSCFLLGSIILHLSRLWKIIPQSCPSCV